MKKEILIGILGIIAILIGSYVIWNSYSDNQQNISSGPLNSSSTVNSIQNKLDEEIAQGEATLSTSVIAQHNVESDCWLLIDGKVYDLSSYMIAHPGGKAIIIPYCGKDATTAFATKDGQGTHSAFAQSELQSLYVGTLNMPLSQIENTNTNTTNQTNTTTPTSPANTTTTSPTTSVVLNTATIAQHNTTGNCWIIINSTVYAVSSYLSAHPGGSAIIAQYCGKDATAAFGNRGGTGTHSSFANSQLTQYAIGTVGSTTTTQIINSTQNTNTTTSPSSNEEEDEEEEEEEEENDD